VHGRSIACDTRAVSNTEWLPRAPAGWIGCSTFASFLHAAIKEPNDGMKTREVLP
jgi:hypothetical protein